jgi:hypothetical protein
MLKDKSKLCPDPRSPRCPIGAYASLYREQLRDIADRKPINAARQRLQGGIARDHKPYRAANRTRPEAYMNKFVMPAARPVNNKKKRLENSF